MGVYVVQYTYTQYCTTPMTAQAKKNSGGSIPERLRRYQASQGITWRRLGERIGISLSMVMMVLRGKRNLSPKALYRLEQAEREAAEIRAGAERIVEELVGDRDVVSQILGWDTKKADNIEVALEYQDAVRSRNLPAKINLARPAEEVCRKLQSLFTETLDTRVIAMACLPKELRAEWFMGQLTTESQRRVTNAALSLVIPNWRTLATGGQ